MKNFKKFLTLVLAVMMIVSSVAFSTSAATTKFEDVDADNEALVKAVDLLSYMGVAKGTSETTFGADELVTRQQFALFIYRLVKGGKDAPSNASNTTKFTDLEDPTYYYAISWANAEGIVNGKSATEFAPKDPIKLQEAYAMIVRALDWEETKDLVYPYGHIEVAEQDGVELDTDLDSSVGYSDNLTRGDMAILLYNAFFAETGIEEVKTRERGLHQTGVDANNNPVYQDYVLEEYTVNPRLCEKAFEVTEVEFRAAATPNYKVNATGVDATYDLGYDAIYFSKLPVSESDVNIDATQVPAAVYLKAEEIGLEGEDLNDYFLGEFTMFVTLKDKGNQKEIDKVLFSDCNMVKKTVTDLKLGEVTSNKATSYYIPTADAKRLSGKIIIEGTEEMYVFNAPYTYANKQYGSITSDIGRYNVRNSENVEELKFTMVQEGDEKIYTAVTTPFLKDASNPTKYDVKPGDLAPTGTWIPFQAHSDDLVAKLSQVYYGGLYEADLYDVNGDGLYDYMNYKPYKIFQVDDDDRKSFTGHTSASGTLGIPYVYTQGADVITDVEYASEDVVLGYYDMLLHEIKIAAVIKPTVTTISNSKKDGTLVLANGDVVNGLNDWKMISNAQNMPTSVVYDADLFNDARYATQAATLNSLFDLRRLDSSYELELYIYNDVVLLHKDLSNNTKFTENLIIPVTYNNEVASHPGITTYRVEAGGFDSVTGERLLYVYAWVDGEAKYVPVYIDSDLATNVVTSVGSVNTLTYDNELCTYDVVDGVYHITPLERDVYDKETPPNLVSAKISTSTSVLSSTTLEDQFMANLGNNLTIEKVAGTRFSILNKGTAANTPLNSAALGNFNGTVELKSYSKIVIREHDSTKNEFIYHTYDASTFKKSIHPNVVLNNVKVILSNNKETEAKEDLVLLYAETNNKFLFKGNVDKNGYRIVSNYDYALNEEEEWMIVYDVYDPYTGAKVSGVPSAETAAKAAGLSTYLVSAGKVVNLVDGKVDKSQIVPMTGVTVANTLENSKNMVWIAGVDETDKFFEVVPYQSFTNRELLKNHIETFRHTTPANDMYGKPLCSNFIEYTADTVVSVMTYGDYNSSFWNWGTMSLSSMSDLAAGVNGLFCYNDKSVDFSGNYQKKYADYVKAYVSVTEETDSTNTKVPVADFVIVLVHGNEGAAVDAPVVTTTPTTPTTPIN